MAYRKPLRRAEPCPGLGEGLQERPGAVHATAAGVERVRGTYPRVRRQIRVGLQGLVRWANEGFSLPVILSVGGTIIAGDLKSEDEYFEGISELLRAGTADVADEDESRWWEQIRELLRGIPSVGDETSMRRLDAGEDPEEILKRRQEIAEAYVHLKTRRFCSPMVVF